MEISITLQLKNKIEKMLGKIDREIENNDKFKTADENGNVINAIDSSALVAVFDDIRAFERALDNYALQGNPSTTSMLDAADRLRAKLNK